MTSKNSEGSEASSREHDYVLDEDATYANGESAKEVFYCTKCGNKHEIIYY